MSKSKRPAWVSDFYRKPRQPTTGTRACNECFAPAYSHHLPTCPKGH